MIKNNKIYFKTPSQTVGPFFGNYLNFKFSKKADVKFNEKIDNKIILNINLKDKKKYLRLKQKNLKIIKEEYKKNMKRI